MREGGRIEFLGNIDTWDETVVNDRMDQPHLHWEISCRDLTARLDQGMPVIRTYEAGPVAPIIKDIIESFMPGENITTNGVVTTGSIQSPIKFTGGSPRSAIQQLCDQTGDVFGIDYYRDLYCFLPGAGAQAPFSFTDTSNNVRAGMFKVTRTNTGKVNVSALRTGTNLG